MVGIFSYAQEFAFGLKGGFNNNSIGEINSIPGSCVGCPDESFSANNDVSFLVGAFLNVEFGKLFVRPEINYVDLKNSYTFPEGESQWSTSKTDIPILIGYKIFDPVSIYAGPGFNFYGDVTMESANNTQGESAINYLKSTTTLNFGVNVEFRRFGIDLRYEVANKDTEIERQDFIFSGDPGLGINQADIFAYTPSQINLSVNVFLFRTNSEDARGFLSGLFRKDKCHCPYSK